MVEPALTGRYRLLELLATGGMGEVFLAKSEGPSGFSKTVVIKRLVRHLAADRLFIQQFVNEAQLAAQLTHPNIAQVFEFGTEDGRPFLVMEYVHGVSLRSVIRREAARGGVVPPEIAAQIAAEALRGLNHAHQHRDDRGRLRQIVHRDVSPENILLSFAGSVKLVDFGIAKIASETQALTQPGTIKGKLAYMSPEQARGEKVDGRADVYAMGVVLSELLTGSPVPLDAQRTLVTSGSTLTSSDGLSPMMPRGVPAEYGSIVDRACSHAVSSRFESANQMAEALDGLVARSGNLPSMSRVASYLQELFPELAASPAPQGSAGPVVTTEASDRLTSAPKSFVRVSAPIQVTSSARARWRWGGVALVIAGVAGAIGIAGSAAPPLAPAAAAVPAPPAVSAEPAVKKTPSKRKEARPRLPLPKATAQGRVSVYAYPWAEVIWQGRSLGMTPLNGISLPVGEQSLTLRNPEVNAERRVIVRVAEDVSAVVKENLVRDGRQN